MNLCNCCGTIRDDQVERCPHCGDWADCLIASQEQIAEGCERIQSGWSKVLELSRRAENEGRAREKHYEIPRVHEPQRGRKRRKGGE